MRIDYKLPANDQETINRLKKYFVELLKIYDWILEEATKIKDLDVPQGITGWPNPNQYYDMNAFDGSIVFEQYYSSPGWFHTPLGKWAHFSSSMGNCLSFEDLMSRIRDKFDLVEIIAQKDIDHYGVIGPVYALQKDIDGYHLPLPGLPYNRGSIDRSTTYEEFGKYWKLVAPDLSKYELAKIARSR